MANSQSTVTLQQQVDIANAFGDLEPILNVGGQSLQPALTAANDVMNAICAVAFPWKWNELILPVFYTNSYQQDYAVVGPSGTGVNNFSWLERGIVLDINNTAIPKPFRSVECGRQLPQATGTLFNSATNNPMFLVNWFPNYMLYYGIWGQPDTGGASANTGFGMLGNNPGPGSVYINPVGPGSQPANPITQIQDANGNFLLLTTYGTESILAPVAPANAAAGTTVSGGSATVTTASWLADIVTFTLSNTSGLSIGSEFTVTGVTPIGYNGTFTVLTISGYVVTAALAPDPTAYVSGGIIVGATTIWTVLDPQAYGFRITPVPSQTGVVWQFNLVAQMKPIRFTNFQQTLAPLPDEMEPHFRQGFIAQLYRYSPEAKVRAKFAVEWQLWLKSLNQMREKNDRELEENRFVPERGVMGQTRARNSWAGSAWPFNYPRWGG